MFIPIVGSGCCSEASRIARCARSSKGGICSKDDCDRDSGKQAGMGAHMANLSLTDDDKSSVRAALFNHLAGIVIVPTWKALFDRKVFDLFAASQDPVPLDQIVNRTHGNRGYLRVA